MSEPSESKHVELKRKSKRFKKTYNLLDFVVIKTKNKKNQQTKRVKVHKQIQKRGKIRKKKVTTIKKRILKERIAKQALADKDAKLLIDEASELVKEFSQIQLNSTSHEEVKDQPLMKASVNVISLLQHSKNFREYCNHFITQEIKRLTELVLKDLFKFQEKKFEQNPVKANANKRYVVGFKEVKKFLVVKRLKLVIIAPDLERNNEIDTLVEETKSLADQHNIPYVFSIKRRAIGYLLLKKVSVSLVGIFDYQGTSENVNNLLNLVAQEKINYRNKSKSC